VVLQERAAYQRRGLSREAVERLAALGDLLLGAPINVTGIREPAAVERFHFLDSLSLLDVPRLHSATTAVDLGSGGGLPALVLAIALPGVAVTAVESSRKKCRFISSAASRLGLTNVLVECGRAEEIGRGLLRDSSDVVTARALASLPVVLEYGLPLVKPGGLLVAMKGILSDQERIVAEKSAAILGGGPITAIQVWPFEDASNRWLYLVEKVGRTPSLYPRRVGVPGRRPLGESAS
jgi:16S rRNA (guanine527-N7)-methyltransferase